MENEQIETAKLSRRRYTPMLLLAAIIVSLCGSFAFGIGINGANPYSDNLDRLIKNHSYTNQLDMMPKNKTNASIDIVEELRKGVPQTLFIVGCFIAAFTTDLWTKVSMFADRKVCLFISVMFFVAAHICSIIGYAAPSASGIIYFGRLLIGYAGGMACIIVPTYLHDISPKGASEKLGIIHQLFITIGIFFGEIVGHHRVLGTWDKWIYAYIIGVFPVIGATVFLPLIPGSPKQIMLQFKNEEGARKALRKLRQSEDIEEDIQGIKKESETGNVEKLTVMQVVTKVEYRWQLITSICVLSCQALCGINAVFFYSEEILKTVTSDIANIQAGVLIIGGLNVLFTFCAFPIINKIGIRKTLTYSMFAMIATHIVLVIMMSIDSTDKKGLQWAIIVVVVLFVFFFAIGLGPIAFMYPNDVFDSKAIDAAMSICLCFNYLGNFIVAIAFLPIQTKIGGYVFLIFAVFVTLTLLLLQFKMQPSFQQSELSTTDTMEMEKTN